MKEKKGKGKKIVKNKYCKMKLYMRVVNMTK